VIAYKIDNPLNRVMGIFITSTSLSDRARLFAKELKINIQEHIDLKKYPSIKCNISKTNNEKIYHLPFDQQYDTTIIENERNEYYLATIKEAESLGFRRAFRWQGNSSKDW